MSNGKIYTLLVFCLSFAVVFGGWFLTKEMLDRKERESLAKKGHISLELVADIDDTNSMVEGKFEGEVLTEDIMAKVLTIWETGGREVFHEPMLGQMNMEQAIDAGRDWIDLLANNNILPDYLAEKKFDNISAVLCTIDSTGVLKNALISYWKVNYVEDDIRIILKIHALSGQVWKGDISMSEDHMLFETRSDEEILSIAFPFLTREDPKIIVENNGLYKIANEEMVYATLKRDSVIVDKQEPMARLLLGLYVNIDDLN